MQFRSRSTRILAAAAIAGSGLVLIAQPASASSVMVDTNADFGPGSFRQAVEDANTDPSIDTITFDSGLGTIDLLTAVEFTGSQDLTIDGQDATVSGAGAPADNENDDDGGWGSGLFVARGGGDLTITDLAFVDSFNNGIGVFLPEAGGTVAITLHGVTVTNAQFHGVLIDGQASEGYNTDGFIHNECTDPYSVGSGTSIDLNVNDTTIEGAGQLIGYDIELATGCPQDFDGLRVDQGGNGDITGSISNSDFSNNLADGVELDEKGNGGVDVTVSATSFNENGDTVSISCPAEQCFDDEEELLEITDLDDGFDIDEEGNGNLRATLSNLTVNANNDEGLDFDEAGNGSIFVTLDGLFAEGNKDQAYKASEEDNGNNTASITDAVIVEGKDDGIEVEEEGNGNIAVSISDSDVLDNGGAGAKIVEADQGNLRADVSSSEITGNDDAGIEVEQEDKGTGSLTVVDTDLSRNDAPISPGSEGDDGIGSITLTNIVF